MRVPRLKSSVAVVRRRRCCVLLVLSRRAHFAHVHSCAGERPGGGDSDVSAAARERLRELRKEVSWRARVRLLVKGHVRSRRWWRRLARLLGQLLAVAESHCFLLRCKTGL